MYCLVKSGLNIYDLKDGASAANASVIHSSGDVIIVFFTLAV